MGIKLADLHIYLGFLCSSAGKESTYNAGDLGSISGLGRSPGEGKGCPFQYSGLENFMDCIVHGVARSHTQLSNFHTTPPPPQKETVITLTLPGVGPLPEPEFVPLSGPQPFPVKARPSLECSAAKLEKGPVLSGSPTPPAPSCQSHPLTVDQGESHTSQTLQGLPDPGRSCHHSARRRGPQTLCHELPHVRAESP